MVEILWSVLWVAPCAGAGIEIEKKEKRNGYKAVAPCAGAGIVISCLLILPTPPVVAPCAGAGIEMSGRRTKMTREEGRPLRGGGD